VNFTSVHPGWAPEAVYQKTSPSEVSNPTEDPGGFPDVISS
jgi:hypothetical protein